MEEQKTIEQRLNEMFDKHEEQRDKIDALLSEEPKISFADKIKALAFPCLLSLNGIFFFSMYQKVGQIDQISTKVDILMKKAELSYNTPHITQSNKEQHNSESNNGFYAEAEHSNTIEVKPETVSIN